MAIAVQPLMVAGTTALQKLPDAVRYIKAKAPKVYGSIADVTAKSKVTPEVIAARGVTSPVIAQGLISAALRAGASPDDFITTGVFGPDRYEEIKALALGYVSKMSDAAEVGTVDLSASKNIDMAVEIRLLREVCGILSVSESQLAVLAAFFRTHGPDDIKAVVDFKKAAGLSAYL